LPRVPGEVSVEVVVQRNGDGSVRLGFADAPDATRLHQMAAELTSSGFVGRTPQPKIEDNGFGQDFLVLHTNNVFDPGPTPHVNVDVRDLCQQILGLGYTSINITFTKPSVDVHRSLTPADEPWQAAPIQTCSSAPAGALILHPQPWRWFLLMALIGLSLTANLVMFRVRRTQPVRRRLVVGLGAIAVVASLGFLTGGAVQAENLMVRGWVDSRSMLTLLNLVTLLLPPLGIWAIAQMTTGQASRPKASASTEHQTG
jgi:hypothetical protein